MQIENYNAVRENCGGGVALTDRNMSGISRIVRNCIRESV